MADDNFSQIFKAYDVRGIYPDQINDNVVRRIGEAYASVKKTGKIAVGGDVRSSTAELKEALIGSLLDAGVDVVDIGTITTDQLYFAVGHYGFEGGISVTASHNPGEYNGLKFVEQGGAPITSEGLSVLRDFSASNSQPSSQKRGRLTNQIILDDYVKHVLSYINVAQIKPFKVVANANFGAVGRAVDIISKKLNLELIALNWKEDGSFPKGPPNPLLPANRKETIELIRGSKPDLGVAWDADADRVFFFTNDGKFIPSCYIIALLSREFLARYPKANIVHDITTAWVIDDTVRQSGGHPLANRTGHTFMKARMRAEDAPFAGESSGHYYFRDSYYADNGLAPFLLILQMLSQSGKSLGELVGPLMDAYKVSEESNFTVSNPDEAVASIEQELGRQGKVDKMDGVAIETSQWRISVRASNTEPLLRLNAESKSQAQLDQIVSKVKALISEVK